MISICMIKICGESIIKPLQMTFKSCIQNPTFPDEQKKANIDPIHKTGEKEEFKNYRPVSLLLICGKIFKQLIHNDLLEFITCGIV